MPIRLPLGRQGPEMPLHRRLRFGRLMEMNVLDTRQYRSDQACGDGRQPRCTEHLDSNRTCLAVPKKIGYTIVWPMLAQQIMIASLRSVDNEGNELWPMDIRDGYPFERQELMDHLQPVATPNPVVLTGDIHSNWATDLKQDFDNEASTTIGSEFVCTSITS